MSCLEIGIRLVFSQDVHETKPDHTSRASQVHLIHSYLSALGSKAKKRPSQSARIILGCPGSSLTSTHTSEHGTHNGQSSTSSKSLKTLLEAAVISLVIAYLAAIVIILYSIITRASEPSGRPVVVLEKQSCPGELGPVHCDPNMYMANSWAAGSVFELTCWRDIVRISLQHVSSE